MKEAKKGNPKGKKPKRQRRVHTNPKTKSISSNSRNNRQQ